MRVLVVTSMYPTPSRPALGGFVRDQVEALREIDGLEVELFAFEPGGASRYFRAARDLRRAHGGGRFDVVHAHYGLAGWTALALGRRAPLLVTFHGTDLSHRVVGPLSRALARVVDVTAPVSAELSRLLPGAGVSRPAPVLPCGVNLERFGRIWRPPIRASRAAPARGSSVATGWRSACSPPTRRSRARAGAGEGGRLPVIARAVLRQRSRPPCGLEKLQR